MSTGPDDDLGDLDLGSPMTFASPATAGGSSAGRTPSTRDTPSLDYTLDEGELDDSEEDGEDDEDTSVLVEQMKAALLNEKAAPDVLHFEEKLVDNLLESLQSQQKVLDTNVFTADAQFYAALYQMEIDRVKYLVASYLRTRLAKLKKFVMYQMSEQPAVLSTAETIFLKQYSDLKEKHFRSAVLDQLPEACRDLDPTEMGARPELDQYVFCHVIEDIGDFQFAEDKPTLRMDKGAGYLLRYSIIQKLLSENKVKLA